MHRQRVATLVIHALTKVKKIRLNAQPLHGLLMSSPMTQVDDCYRVTVEVAVKGLDHIRVHTHARETLVDAHAHVTHACITQHRITPDQSIIAIA